MKQSKRLFALLLTLAMTLGMLTACGGVQRQQRADRLHGIPRGRGGLLLQRV